jgi:hypothetical protein
VTGTAPDTGRYSIPGIPTGAYDITVTYGNRHPKDRKGVVLNGTQQQVDFVLDAPCDSCGSAGQNGWSKRTEAWLTVAVVVLFVINIWAVRWNNIVWPNRELLIAEIDKAHARFKTETGRDLTADDPLTGHLFALLDAASRSVNRPNSLWDFLFWTRGREITAWSRIYELQRDSVSLYKPGSLPMILSRLQALELDLLDIDKAHAKTLAGNIKDLIDKQAANEAALSAMLVEALTYLNNQNDSTFAQLVGWQTKAVWLVGVGSVLIVVLAMVVGNAVLFVTGATGGYLSRMARQLKRADVPSDYGASWTTLFLSPILGALSGWFGILLIVLMADSSLLGAAFQQIEWSLPLAPLTLGLAFAFGFSERLFDGIISSLEDKVDSDRQAATQPKQPIPPSKPIPPAPPLTIGTTKLPDGAVQTPYQTKLEATAGTAPLKWSVTPALPAGLTLDAVTGIISGTPTASARTPITITVTDSATPPASTSTNLTLEIK